MTTFITIVGFLGAACFASCTFPQILRVLKRKSTADISLLFILLSLGGNLCSATYIFYTNWVSGYWQIPQYFNYTIATTLVITLLCLKIKYDKEQLKSSFKSAIERYKTKYRKIRYYLFVRGENLFTTITLGVFSTFILLYLIFG